jgi:protein-S-isoprenylcysteine O-methyltransferase Ste14
MDDTAPLATRAFRGLAFFLVVMAAILFATAWTFAWWQAWLYLVVFAATVTFITAHFLKTDPALIERRLKAGPGAEKERVQRIVQAFASAAFILVIVVPGLDRRFGWSSVPALVVIAGDVLVVLGLAVVFLVFRENSYTSAVIEVGATQPVTSTGPYAYVRHPMYAGALVMVLGMPLALGSWWGLLTWLPMTAAIIVRLLDEERYLAVNLPGYAAYMSSTPYRLIPRVW